MEMEQSFLRLRRAREVISNDMVTTVNDDKTFSPQNHPHNKEVIFHPALPAMPLTRCCCDVSAGIIVFGVAISIRWMAPRDGVQWRDVSIGFY
jgi:hypothetical protein